MKKSSLPETVSGEELAQLLNVDIRTVRNLAMTGRITRLDRNRYELVESVRGLIAAAKKSSKNSALEREQAAILAGKRKLMELRLAEEDGRLIELAESLDLLSEVVGTLRASLEGVPAKITRDIALRSAIKNEIDAALTKAAAKFEALAKGESPNAERDD